MKIARKTLASILVLCMVLQLTAIGVKLDDFETGKESKTKNDPYSLMYDSDEKLVNKLEDMPDFFTEETEEALLSPDKSAQNLTISDQASNKDSKVKDQVLELVKAGRTDEIDDLDLPDETKAEINSLSESVKEDRYIVKYRSESEGSIPELMSKEKDRANVLHSERSGNLEVLVLNEKVNPQEFAETLQNAGADDEIEYIQPDFRMEYASLDGSLSMSLLDDEEEAEISDTIPEDEPSDEASDASTLTNNDAYTISPAVVVAVIDTGVDITHGRYR